MMSLWYIGDMMMRITSEGMVGSVALGYAAIANMIGTSQYNMYPTHVLIAAAFGVGIAMVVGTAYFFISEPRIKPRTVPVEVKDINPFHTVTRRPYATPA